MTSVGLKRLLVGRPFRTDHLGSTLLPKRIALPVLSADAMSTVAYAPEEIFLVLSSAGVSAVAFSPLVAIGVAVVMVVVVASYRQNVRAYPSGGGDYEVVSKNVGARTGLVVGSALLVEYTLTVAVSVSAAVSNIGSLVVLLAAVNLRGVRESQRAFALLTYGFLVVLATMLTWGFFQIGVLGRDLRAVSAGYELTATDGDLVGFALVVVLAKAFASGCASLTGVESVSNAVPAFRRPKAQNAATTLLLLGVVTVLFLLSLTALAHLVGVQMAVDPATQLLGAPADYQQKTLLAQLSGAVFAGVPALGAIVPAVAAVMLMLAANTAFTSFPVLGSVLARDDWLPRQLHTRGDRLAFSNGILTLAGIAIGFIVLFDASVSRLVQLYVIGVFIAFSLGQLGMVVHWSRRLRYEQDVRVRRACRRSRAVNGIGLALTSGVLLVILSTRVLTGGWLALLVIAAFFAVMMLVRRHYATVDTEIASLSWSGILPSRTSIVVLVSKLHMPTRRALAYARAARPDSLEAVTVNVDDAATRRLVRQWQDSDVGVPLKVIEAPYREITRPVLGYVRRLRADAPRDLVNVYIPEFVVGRWWEKVLHNQSAARLGARLLAEPNVVVTTIPWQSTTVAGSSATRDEPFPGLVRHGRVPPPERRLGAPEDGPRDESDADRRARERNRRRRESRTRGIGGQSR